MTKWLRLTVALLSIAVAGSAATQRMAVADHDGRAVLIIDMSEGKTISSIALGTDTPDQVLATPDGSRIVAITRGPGKTTWLGEFRPTAQASATVIDGASSKILQRIDLGWDASDAQITKDGRTLVVLSPGVDAKAPDGKNAALYAIDLAKAAVSGKTDFDRVAKGMLVAGDQKVAAVYFQGNRRANRPNTIRFVDIASMQTAGEGIAIPGEVKPPATFSGHDFIYVLDTPKRQAANVYVISASQQKLTGTFTLQQNPNIIGYDESSGRLFVSGQSASKGQKGQNGQLVVFRNGAPEKTIPVADNPLALAYTADRKNAIITGSSVTLVALDPLEAKGQIKEGAAASEIYVSPDGRRAYFYLNVPDASSRVTVFDLPGMTQMKSYMVGSSGMRWAKGLAAVALTAASYSAGRSAAASSGRSSFYYTIYSPWGANGGRGMMAVRDDSKFAYAVDPNTGYVSVIDGESGERLEGIRVRGAYELVALKDNSILAVAGSDGVTFIDTGKNDKSAEATIEGSLRGLETTADRSRLIALYDGKLAVYDERGKLLGDTSVKRPAGWVFLP